MSKRGGHGGAWKVAYADFVTAMMALFLVLWIVASSQDMKQGIAGYFRSASMNEAKDQSIGMLAPITQVSSKKRDPKPTPQTPSSSADVGGDPDTEARGGEEQGPSKGASGLKWTYRILAIQDALREEVVNAATSIQKLLVRNNREMTDMDEFRFEFLNDGLRIQALDKVENPLFEPGTARLTPHGEWALKTIVWEMERFPFRIEIEGHTSGKGSTPTAEQSVDPWDLSTRRAMVAQQFLNSKGMSAKQFWRVAGYADRVPLETDDPESPANRRITLTFRLDPDTDFEQIKRAFSPP